ncbi:hypothetical protein TL16_g04791 [Triparma laevis f. inornata]|nr:hypothetical protein TL16_g04791 [Triparma laevis f. inornata]
MSSPPNPTPAPSPPTPQSPYDTASFWSHTSFSYVHDLLVLGYSRPLLKSDLPSLPSHDSSTKLSSKLQSTWDHQRSISSTPSLTKAIYSAHKFEFWLAGVWTILEHICMLLQPLLLSLFLNFLTSTTSPSSTGYIYAFLLFLTSFLQAIFHHQTYYITMRAGWNLRISLTILTHSKLLKLNLTESSQYAGVAMNLVSNDVFRFDNFCPAIWHYFTGPADGVAILFLLTKELNFPPAFLGIIIVLFDVFLKLYLGKKIGSVRSTTSKLTDARVTRTGELLNGIETVKSYNWDGVFKGILRGLREREHESIFRSQFMKGINFSMVLATPAVASLAMFGLYNAMYEEPLTIERVLGCIALINVLRTSIGKEMSRATENGPECYIAVKRFERFLGLDETEEKSKDDDAGDDDDESSSTTTISFSSSSSLLEIDNASFTWPKCTDNLSSKIVKKPKGNVIMYSTRDVDSTEMAALNTIPTTLQDITLSLK